MKRTKSHQSFSGKTEFYEHSSTKTGTTMKFSVFRPANIEDTKGGLVWLSGLTCNEENFITKAGAQKTASELGLAIICPDTSPRGLDLPGEHDSYDFGSGASFYVDATTEGYKDSYQMYSYIHDELYNLFDQEFKLNGNIGIFGHSMGGHGALTIGLKNPKKFKSISAFSPIVNPVNCEWGKKTLTGYLGQNQKDWEQYDACSLIKKGHLHPSKILVEQGLADEFYPEQLLTKNLEKACQEYQQSLDVSYHENYDHSYYFISSFMDKHLRHHAGILSNSRIK